MKFLPHFKCICLCMHVNPFHHAGKLMILKMTYFHSQEGQGEVVMNWNTTLSRNGSSSSGQNVGTVKVFRTQEKVCGGEGYVFLTLHDVTHFSILHTLSTYPGLCICQHRRWDLLDSCVRLQCLLHLQVYIASRQALIYFNQHKYITIFNHVTMLFSFIHKIACRKITTVPTTL